MGAIKGIRISLGGWRAQRELADGVYGARAFQFRSPLSLRRAMWLCGNIYSWVRKKVVVDMETWGSWGDSVALEIFEGFPSAS